MSTEIFNLGIVGGGFVGGTCKLFESEKNKVKIFDLDPSKCTEGVTCLEDLKGSDLIFIAVPTPMVKETGECYTVFVENAINQVREKLGKDSNIVIRSTVPVGFSRKHKVMMVPEFLTEAKPKEDFLNCKNWYIGINENVEEMKSKFETLFNNSFPDVSRDYLSTDECEMIKHFRNTFLITKVIFCNEMYDICNAFGINYENIRKYSVQDQRVGSSHTLVPGPDGKRFGGGHCLIKDLNSMICQAEKLDLSPTLLKTVRDNNVRGRPEQDWNLDKGRAVI